MSCLYPETSLESIKTIPTHFCPVHEATRIDVARIFGDGDEPTKRYFNIGNPLDMNTPVCLDLERLTERSNGIFGIINIKYPS